MNGAFIGTASVKIKGIANSSGTMWDTYDLVHPAKERDAAFVATLIEETVGQKKGTCGNPGAPCAGDYECTVGEYEGIKSDLAAKALQTGVCRTDTSTCEVAGWCPLEAKQTVPTIDDVRKWTAFIRIDGSFPSLDDSRAFSTVGEDTELTQYKNLFFMQDIVAAASLDDPCLLPKFTDGVSDATEPVCSDAAFKASAAKGTIILMNVDYGTSKVSVNEGVGGFLGREWVGILVVVLVFVLCAPRFSLGCECGGAQYRKHRDSNKAIQTKRHPPVVVAIPLSLSHLTPHTHHTHT